MIEQLFGSRTRVKLLRLFLSQPEKSHYVRELTRIVDERINSVRRELDNLSTMGLLESEFRDKKKYYLVKKNFGLYHELRSLILKSHVLHEGNLVEDIKRIGSIDYLLLTGQFVGVKNIATDILVVGKPDRKRLTAVVQKFEEDFERELRYTVMNPDEFRYRKEIGDTFLMDILAAKNLVIIDHSKQKEKVPAL